MLLHDINMSDILRGIHRECKKLDPLFFSVLKLEPVCPAEMGFKASGGADHDSSRIQD